MEKASISEIVYCLLKDLGRKAGILYARRVERVGGILADDYRAAAEILEGGEGPR